MVQKGRKPSLLTVCFDERRRLGEPGVDPDEAAAGHAKRRERATRRDVGAVLRRQPFPLSPHLAKFPVTKVRQSLIRYAPLTMFKVHCANAPLRHCAYVYQKCTE